VIDALLSAPVTLALLAANLIASLLALNNQEFFRQNALTMGPLLKRNEWHRVITAGFLHVDYFHLFFNMFALVTFGPVIEMAIGGLNYLLIYMGALLGGNAWEVISKRGNPDYSSVGASGALSGISLTFGILAPFAVILLFGIVPLWAIGYGFLFIAISYALSNRPNAIIAHGAHLGGALAGAALTVLLVPQAVPNLLREFAEKFG
jgi:membrane associated rhomboid family serine protease